MLLNLNGMLCLHTPSSLGLDESPFVLVEISAFEQVLIPSFSLQCQQDHTQVGAACQAKRECIMAGYIRSKSDRTKCEPCPEGTVASSSASVCTACAPGLFSSERGAAKCISCKVAGHRFQPNSGQTFCLDCPVRTQLRLAANLSSPTVCVCVPGAWRPDGHEGRECLQCPSGARCDGWWNNGSKSKIAVPYPDPDLPSVHWALRNELTGELKGYPFHGTINESFSNPNLPPPTLFYECGDRCLGGMTFACKKGHSGVKCSDCASGYAHMAGICVKCFDSTLTNFTLAFVLILCVLLVWVGLNSMSAGSYDGLDVGLGFLQILSIVTSFTVPTCGQN